MVAVTWAALGILAAVVFGNFFYLGAKIARLSSSLNASLDRFESSVNASLDRLAGSIDIHVDRHTAS